MFHDAVDNLLFNVVDVLTTLDCGNVVHKRDLSCRTVRHSKTHFPEAAMVFGRVKHNRGTRRRHAILGLIRLAFGYAADLLDCLHVHFHVLLKVANLETLAVEKDLCAVNRTSHIIHTLH